MSHWVKLTEHYNGIAKCSPVWLNLDTCLQMTRKPNPLKSDPNHPYDELTEIFQGADTELVLETPEDILSGKYDVHPK